VEFIALEEWRTELKVLVAEICTQATRTLLVVPPQANQAPDAHAAWCKIEQVYGFGRIGRFDKSASQQHVYNKLANDRRVVELLTPTNPGVAFNSHKVYEGDIVPGSSEAINLANGKEGGRLRKKKKKLGKLFRAKINDYVYRKGNGDQPQSWPLIRKVVIHGPWPVLQSGACLVDLPGVRDANAARAKVAESYLRNCNLIWIVAPIKRAVDDGTAKELLGEQFRRRLLMDGQYANVSFICTQTDDCEATEIMRDHADVAQRQPGRWEEMEAISGRIREAQIKMNELAMAEEDLIDLVQDARREHKQTKQKLKRTEKRRIRLIQKVTLIQALWRGRKVRVPPSLEVEEEQQQQQQQQELGHTTLTNAAHSTKITNLNKSLLKLQSAAEVAAEVLTKWKGEHSAARKSLSITIARAQRKLKPLCALVRNEYSTTRLQEDFRQGLDELTRGPDVEEHEMDMVQEHNNEEVLPVIPSDFQMKVHCISANDFLKITGVKPATDGRAACFRKAVDTGIPLLRSFVHTTTARLRLDATISLIHNTSDFLDRVKLYAADTSELSSAASSGCKGVFENAMTTLADNIKKRAKRMSASIETRVDSTLTPALNAGAKKGTDASSSIVSSWGSKQRRTKQHRSPEQNGLYWSTYFATCRRSGIYTSASAGPVRENLCLFVCMYVSFSYEYHTDPILFFSPPD